MMTIKKKITSVVLLLLAVGVGIFVYGGWSMFGDEIMAIRSLRMVEDGVYTFTYKGDYGFKGFIEQGGAKTDADMARYIANFLSHGYMTLPAPDEAQAGCTSLQSPNVFGRNFDFKDEGQHVVLVRTEPTDGYKSIATSTFAFIGNGADWRPVAGMDGFTALATIYIPLDGMNEKGVCVADLIEIDGDTTLYDTPKPDLTIVAAIRLVLDYAASVDEAIGLLKRYDIHPSIGSAHHLAIADATRSVAVEWKGGQMHVSDTTAVTNHCLWEDRQNELTGESRNRLERIKGISPKNQNESLVAMKSASYKDETLWTVLYDRKSMHGTWYVRCDWNHPVEMGIQDKD